MWLIIVNWSQLSGIDSSKECWHFRCVWSALALGHLTCLLQLSRKEGAAPAVILLAVVTANLPAILASQLKRSAVVPVDTQAAAIIVWPTVLLPSMPCRKSVRVQAATQPAAPIVWVWSKVILSWQEVVGSSSVNLKLGERLHFVWVRSSSLDYC